MLRVKNNNNGTWHEIYYGYFLTPELEILKPWRWNSKFVFLTLLFSVYWQLFRTAVPPFKPLSTFNVTHYHLGIFKTKKIQIERKIKKKSFSKKIKRKKFHAKALLERFVWMTTAQDFTYEAKNYTYTMPLSVSQYL